MRLNEPATGYIAKDGSCVVRNDRAGAIVQVSDKHDPRLGCSMGLIYMEEVLVSSLSIIPTKEWGDNHLFNKLDSIELLDCCKRNNIFVLGIESFRISNGKRVPDMGCIVDFSDFLKIYDDNLVERSVETSKLFISEVGDLDIYFEFVLIKV